MTRTVVRILLLADTHLGFDLPLRPRVVYRRRGPDFFLNTERALTPALIGAVDVVVHGGDLLYRSKVPARLVDMALEPLLQVADRGVPVILVPGNHERSAIPFPLLAAHRHLHILDRPQTVRLDVAGMRLAVAGFPCVRDGIRDVFVDAVGDTGVEAEPSDIRVLCLHQTVEGATVGPGGFVFRTGPDIVRGRDIPAGFGAVLAGHIHRAQVLTHDLAGRRLAAPVFYPGSVERTSFAERAEAKGFMTIEMTADGSGAGRVVGQSFHELATRPLVDLAIDALGLDAEQLAAAIGERLRRHPSDAVVRLSVFGEISESAGAVLAASRLRNLAPETMTVTLRRARGVSP